MDLEDESRNARDRAGHIEINRTSSEAKKARFPLRSTIHTQLGSRYSKGPKQTGQNCEN